MRIRFRSAALTACACAFLLTGCDAAPTETPVPQLSHAAVLATATGSGTLDAGVDVRMAFSAVQLDASGSAAGQLRFSTELGGLAIEFHGQVTCLAVDAVNNRAWIGGVITQNNSEHPAFTGAIHQVGRDIWFRVVDYGQGASSSQPDRSTFVGFEGGGGIDTSEEYCEVRIWPGPPEDVVDARTGPVTSGNITVRG